MREIVLCVDDGYVKRVKNASGNILETHPFLGAKVRGTVSDIASYLRSGQCNPLSDAAVGQRLVIETSPAVIVIEQIESMRETSGATIAPSHPSIAPQIPRPPPWRRSIPPPSQS
jgi:hypothetical protein